MSDLYEDAGRPDADVWGTGAGSPLLVEGAGDQWRAWYGAQTTPCASRAEAVLTLTGRLRASARRATAQELREMAAWLALSPGARDTKATVLAAVEARLTEIDAAQGAPL